MSVSLQEAAPAVQGDEVRVTIRPLGRTIAARAGANLLDVLREQQVPISYSCMAGRCSTCRCTVVDGALMPVEPAATGVVGPPAGQVLACQSLLAQDCTIEIPDPGEVVVHPARILKATVVAIEDLTHDIRRLQLRPAKPLAFSPGQYANLQFSPEHIRPYSMAGLKDDGELEFHVRVVPGGKVSGYIANTLKPGDAVRVSGPLGTAYLRRKHEGPMLCVAGGTGLAPILSIVRGALAAGMRNPIHLYFGARSAADIYGVHWLRDLATDYLRLQLHFVAEAARSEPMLRTGRVTEAVAQDWKSLAGFRAYLCGAPPMVEAATALVEGLGLAAENVHADAFYTIGS